MIFVDTSFWVALRNQRDGHQDEAKRLLAQHVDTQLTTTNHVRGESWICLQSEVRENVQRGHEVMMFCSASGRCVDGGGPGRAFTRYPGTLHARLRV